MALALRVSCELIFVFGVRQGSTLFLQPGEIQLFQHHLWSNALFPTEQGWPLDTLLLCAYRGLRVTSAVFSTALRHLLPLSGNLQLTTLLGNCVCLCPTSTVTVMRHGSGIFVVVVCLLTSVPEIVWQQLYWLSHLVGSHPTMWNPLHICFLYVNNTLFWLL